MEVYIGSELIYLDFELYLDIIQWLIIIAILFVIGGRLCKKTDRDLHPFDICLVLPSWYVGRFGGHDLVNIILTVVTNLHIAIFTFYGCLGEGEIHSKLDKYLSTAFVVVAWTVLIVEDIVYIWFY